MWELIECILPGHFLSKSKQANKTRKSEKEKTTQYLHAEIFKYPLPTVQLKMYSISSTIETAFSVSRNKTTETSINKDTFFPVLRGPFTYLISLKVWKADY